jgi:hypothetical protein
MKRFYLNLYFYIKEIKIFLLTLFKKIFQLEEIYISHLILNHKNYFNVFLDFFFLLRT